MALSIIITHSFLYLLDKKTTHLFFKFDTIYPMQFEDYEIVSIYEELPNIYLLRVKSKDKKSIPTFKPGQFYHIKNPQHEKHETRPFSVVTTPIVKEYLEFYIKPYGPWTKKLLEKTPGETILLFGPMGSFTKEKHMNTIVCIAAGVGITPILSILNSLEHEKTTQEVTLIYANKLPHTILQRKTLENLFAKKNDWKFIPIVSNTTKDVWDGQKGRITNALLQKEIDFTKDTTFFISGSQDFTKEIVGLLKKNNVEESKIKQEIFSVAKK
jgi:NAD(P)H-flavin reductase